MKDTGQILAEILLGGELRIHLIGVAGSGMSGLAGLLMALGHRVSGSDKVTTKETERLEQAGLRFICPQRAEAVAGADLVVYSSAIRPGNPEYDEALRQGTNMVRRADALAAVLNGKGGIVVAGTHGKTTTSALTAHVLRVAGLKPSHYVGAEIPILGANACWDPEGEYFVAEGDESDGTLAFYHPAHAIILNIEEEHLDYYENLAAIDAVFAQLAAQTSGKIIYCADQVGAVRVCRGRPGAVSFGEDPAADYRFQVVLSKAFRSGFKVFKDGVLLGDFALNIPGRHNISNATAVVALATEVGVAPGVIAEAFDSFRGARRRFEVKYRSDQYMVVDDYGHHPSEVRATLEAARAVGRKRLLVMFQPHRYSRTLALKDEFGRSFGDADAVWVADVYPASEPPIPGVGGQTVVEALEAAGRRGATHVPDRRALVLEVGRAVRPGDLVVSLGAGDIHEQGAALAADLGVLEELLAVMGPGGGKLYEPLAKHTTMRVGGPAQYWLEPESEAGFAALVKHCHRNALPLTVIGRGSNLLVLDGGIRGAVVHLGRGEFKRLEVADGEILAGAGVKLKELAMAARDAGIGGLEWMEGIPGMVGGGLRMNAGAMGAQMFDNVRRVRVVDPAGNLGELAPAAIEVHYRNAPTLEKNYAVAAWFGGAPRAREEIERLLRASMAKRRGSQPAASSAGCIFKNPAACPAGKLIDELGLKGLRVGGAEVSPVHGNFIVNSGGATAADILALMRQVQEIAFAQRGVRLVPEVKIIGEPEGIHV